MAKKILIDWRPKFSQEIRSRGMDYYQKNRVRDIEHSGNLYRAEVIGSGGRHYATTVALSTHGSDVEMMDCTCPFAEDGSHCKHEAALLYAIEERFEQITESIQDTDNEEAGELTPEQMLGGPGFKVDAKKKVYFESPEVPEENKNGVAALMNYRYFMFAEILKSAKISESIWKKGVSLVRNRKMTLTKVNFRGASPQEIAFDEHPDWLRDKLCIATGRLQESYFETSICIGPDYFLHGQCYVIGCKSGFYTIDGGRYNGKICEHEAALLYLMKDYLDKDGMEQDATDEGGADLMRALSRESRISAILESTVTLGAQQEVLDIEPTVSVFDQHLTLTFRVGGNRKYKIQRLNEFYHAMQAGEKKRYGKNELQLGEAFFSEHGRKIFRFLQDIAKESGYSIPGGSLYRMQTEHDLSQYKDEILLYGHFLDDFYDLNQGIQVPATGLMYAVGEDPKYLVMGDDPIQARVFIDNLTDRAGRARGIYVHGEMPFLFQGQKYAYFIRRGKLNRIGSQDAEMLRPFSQISEDGVFDFQIGLRNLTKFYYETLPWLQEHATVEFSNEEWIENYLMPQAKFTFFMDRENSVVTCRALANYDRMERNLAMPAEEADGFRDFVTEEDAKTILRQYFPAVDRETGLFVCDEEKYENLVYELLQHGLDELVTFGEVRHTDSFLALQIKKHPKIQVGVSLESALMDLEIGAEDMSPDELLALLDSYRKKKKYYRLRSGDFVSVEGDEIENLSRLMEDMHISLKEFVEGKMQLPAYRALYLDRMLEGQGDIYEHRDRHFKKLIQEFETISDAEFDLPANVHANLRKYQEEGYQWIRTLFKYNFGGILADEMGLGKTLQTIAVLQAEKEENAEVGTSLIIVPASLVYNWGEELKRFAPGLSYILVTGTKEERDAQILSIEEYDVAITSYDLLKRDIAEYETHSFHCEIIDEAQYIKNHSSQAAKSVKLIHAAHRIALTGTPIENRLSELWSIFDYLMPGLLYTYEQFRAEFEIPVMKYEEEDVMMRLRAMVTPFILRRKKSDVLKDLPDKLEEVRYAQMEEQQQRLYDAQVLHMKNRLKEQGDDEFNRNRIEILAELTRIRQICCDPSLCFEDYKGSSAKTDVCMDMIGQVIEGEHKALIFSQFVTMLEILKKRLDAENIPYYEITGSTPKEKRIELVNAFNEDTTPVFLISLKAGGTGLNLTGADVVIHYDPWWNLAVQNQATDRAHRIGQKNVVTVFKLIAHGTIEDRIVEMQEKKRALAENILSGEGISSASLSKDDLLELLS